MNYDTAPAVSCLTSIYLDGLRQGTLSFEEFEDFVIEVGHDAMVRAQSSALELFDEELYRSYTPGLKVKERKRRSPATQIGDTSFTRHICIDAYGSQVVPLDEVLDLPRYSRISPGAAGFLANAGIEVSYAKAAHLLEACGGSRVSARSVMWTACGTAAQKMLQKCLSTTKAKA